MSLLVCLALAVCACPALAQEAVEVEKDTQMSKLQGQLRSSGFRADLTGELTGSAPGFIEPALWERLGRILNNYTLNFTHTQASPDGDEGSEGILRLRNKTGDDKARVNLVMDAAGVRYLQSPLMDDEGMFYAFDSSFDWLTLVLPTENGWPSLLHVALELSRGSKNWQDKTAPYMEAFSLSVERWLQNYLISTSETDDSGNYLTTLTYEIPVVDVVMQTKQLLLDVYSKPELLALAAEVMTQEEQAAYLQKDMYLAFIAMLDRVDLTGSVQISRQNETATGTMLYESISMPFPAELPVNKATLSHVPNAVGGELWQMSLTLDAQALNVALDRELQVDINAQNTEGAIWTGSLRAFLPTAESTDAVSHTELQLFSCTYNLNIPEPQDVNDVYQARYERRYEATLVVKPDSPSNVPAFSMSFEAVAYSKKNTPTSPSYLDGSLEWNSLEADCTAKLSLSARTGSSWTPTMLNDALSSAIRVDMMSAATRGELIDRLWSSFKQRLLNILE
jgi:hypothetical protein